MKKYSPKALALLIAAAMSFVSGVGLIIYLVSQNLTIKLGAVFIIMFLTLGITYLFTLQIFKKYLHDRIKVIYKTIKQAKAAGSAAKEIPMEDDVIDAVQQEVVDWARNQQQEIEYLKKEEQFRKDFVGNLAHELKTPIFNIQGYLLTLLDGGLEDDNINRNYLQRAENSVERMTRLIEDMDVIAKHESAQLKLDIKRTNLLELVNDVIESFEIRAKKENIVIKLDGTYDYPIWVHADQGKIRQVLTNLISNSIKYCEKQGEIEIRFYDMDDTVLVEVADNGIGIASHHLPRLFERFYRVDKSRSRDKGGTGIGLAIVKHIIEAHQQQINVRSTEEVGTTFSFTLKKF